MYYVGFQSPLQIRELRLAYLCKLVQTHYTVPVWCSCSPQVHLPKLLFFRLTVSCSALRYSLSAALSSGGTGCPLMLFSISAETDLEATKLGLAIRLKAWQKTFNPSWLTTTTATTTTTTTTTKYLDTHGIMTYQHDQIYVAWDFVRSMWETNGKSHAARLLGYPNKACHGASTTPNEGLPNAPGEPGLAVNRSWTDPQSLGLVSHLREMELHPNKHVFAGSFPKILAIMSWMRTAYLYFVF